MSGGRKRLKTKLEVPLVQFSGATWGDLSAFGDTHDIVGTGVKQGGRISFIGGHRVTPVRLKQMVHWKIPAGVDLDISDVGQPARRQLR